MKTCRWILMVLALGWVGCRKEAPTNAEASEPKPRLFRAYPSTHKDTSCTPFLEKIQPTLLILEKTNLVPFPKPKKCPRFVLLYFSASWCPPCHLFTPKLKTWYLGLRKKHPELEVVLASMDRDWGAMQQYVSETKMPWPIMAWPQVMDSPVEKYLPEEIPYLVLLDDEGRILVAARGMPSSLGLIEEILGKEEIQ